MKIGGFVSRVLFARVAPSVVVRVTPRVSSAAAFAMALVLAPAMARSEHAPSPTPLTPALTTVVSFDPALGQLPESIAEDPAGNLYVSIASTVVKVTPERVVSTLVALPVAAGAFARGVKLGPEGGL